jgi:hypothetical protein
LALFNEPVQLRGGSMCPQRFNFTFNHGGSAGLQWLDIKGLGKGRSEIVRLGLAIHLPMFNDGRL